MKHNYSNFLSFRYKLFWFLYCKTQINQSSRNKPFSFVKNWICYIRQVKYNTFIRLEKWNWLRIKHEFFISRFAATRWYCIFVGLLRFEIMTSLWNSKNAGREDGRIHLKQINCWSVSFLNLQICENWQLPFCFLFPYHRMNGLIIVWIHISCMCKHFGFLLLTRSEGNRHCSHLGAHQRSKEKHGQNKGGTYVIVIQNIY